MEKQLEIQFDKNSEERVKNFFYSVSQDLRKKLKNHYERLIAIENDKLEPVINFKTGRTIKYIKMPHMLPFWTRGLELLTEVMKEKNEIN